MDNNDDNFSQGFDKEYIKAMGSEAMDIIFNFFTKDIGLTYSEITKSDIEGWRKFYSLEECCKELHLDNCHSWDDVAEYYIVHEVLSDGAVLVALFS